MGMAKNEAIEYLKEQIETSGNILFVNNDNEACLISKELDALDGDAPDIVCDYSEFSFFAVSEIIDTGREAISIYEASRADEYGHVTLCKYADPYEREIVGIEPAAASDVIAEDPGLIYLVALA